MIPKEFIVIDDNHFNNTLCKMVIRRTLKMENIQTFTEPEKGFEYLISTQKQNGIIEPTLLFLDINMPTMTGWEFLVFYDKLDIEIKKNIAICMLSSSVDSRDKNKADENKYVMNYMVKPITGELLIDLIKKLENYTPPQE